MPGIIILITLAMAGSLWYWYDVLSAKTTWAMLAVIFIGVSFLAYDYTRSEPQTIIIEGKDRGADDGSYRIYTDGDTLSVKDIYLSTNPRFDSADVYGDLRVCHKYKVTVRGWEFGFFFSMMPNIVEIVEDLGPVDGCNSKE